MKRVLFVLLIAGVLFTGCKEKPKNPIKEYGTALINSYERAKDVSAEADLSSIRKALSIYYAQNGRYPETLTELSVFSGMEIPSERYTYNPKTGEVSLK